MAGRITIIGSSNVDMAMKMEHLPAPGETVTDASFMQTFGGKGANQAVAAARAVDRTGAATGGRVPTVSFVNCVGDDPYAKRMVANFESDGIDTSHIFHETGIASGTALIMVGESGQNYLSIAPGANYRLTPQRIDGLRDLIAESEWILLQYEIPAETLERVLDVAAEVGSRTVFNFAPVRAFPRDRLTGVHTLVVNENEAAALAGRTVDGEAEARNAAETLLSMGTEVVIITLGPDGSVVAANGEMAHVKAFPVQAVDTTAAGDTYCGSLAVALNEGKPLSEAVQFASAAAALSVQKMGAQPSAPWRSEIDAFLAEQLQTRG